MRVKHQTQTCHITQAVNNQKGAMFGLDARIALAIFGGLSVIAGAAVFGAISETNVTALVTEFDNYSKGYINHVLDTGTDTNTIAQLWANAAATPNWNGPYVTVDNATHSKYGTLALAAGRPDTTTQDPAAATCSAGNLCSMWLTLTNVTTAVADALDIKVDGGTAISADTGNIRLSNAAAGVKTVFYKMARCQTDTC